ncbi:MAG TPA: helix-turn-helix domain-containing protein [Candidatus Lachnoclostridium pullistercoris]|uniref:Helix-turn-helix domain-containing protein n=1 Tax=Candidatus Lachnoclostridium pullistercoris TaxID=2838632 RepID=A0A9D2PA89_9FIRM|nr:helix-turn-helix domain-containing protein [Candidatus Lachnoclostridium pullistercoris]
MNNKVIGINIKKYRKAAGFTQEKLAELLDVSTVHMSHIECGHVSMSLEVLLRLCDCLSVTPNELLYGIYQETENKELSILNEMDEETKLLAMQILDLLRKHEERIKNRGKI